MNALSDFNTMVNQTLDPLVSNQVVFGVLKILLICYGSLAAPKVPVQLAGLFSNTYFRVAYMFFIIWVFNHDPGLAILIAVTYFMSMNYLVQNSVTQVEQTGVVTPEIAILISGGSGPSIKSESVMTAEAHLMQQSVDAAKSAGSAVVDAVKSAGSIVVNAASSAGSTVTQAAQPDSHPTAESAKSALAPTPESKAPLPEAVLSTGTGANAGSQSIPSGNNANTTSMTAMHPGSDGVPKAFIPDSLFDLAAAPTSQK